MSNDYKTYRVITHNDELELEAVQEALEAAHGFGFSFYDDQEDGKLELFVRSCDISSPLSEYRSDASLALAAVKAYRELTDR